MRSRIILVLAVLSLFGYGCGETTSNNSSDGGTDDGGDTSDGGNVDDGGAPGDGGSNPGPMLTTFQSLLEANEALHETICYCDDYYGSYCEAMSQEILPLLSDEESCVNDLYAANSATVDPWVNCMAAAWVDAESCYEDEECGKGRPKGIDPPDGGEVDCDDALEEALDACPELPEAVVTGYEDCVEADEASVALTGFLAIRTLCIECTGDASECKEAINDESLECMEEGIMYILDDYEPEDPQAMLDCLQETYKRAMLCWAQDASYECMYIFYDAGEECGVDPEDMEALLYECSDFYGGCGCGGDFRC